MVSTLIGLDVNVFIGFLFVFFQHDDNKLVALVARDGAFDPIQMSADVIEQSRLFHIADFRTN